MLYQPHPNYPVYPHDTDAQLLDLLIEDWALDISRGLSLAEKCFELDKTAQTCGIEGLLLAEGAMSRLQRRRRPFIGKVFSIGHPTYYTMGSILFTPPSSPGSSSSARSDGDIIDGASVVSPDVADELKSKRLDVQKRIENLLQFSTTHHLS